MSDDAHGGGAAPTPRGDVSPWRERTLVLAVLALGLGLRLFHLGWEDLWLDEAVTMSQARLPLADLIGATAGDNYPPLHNLSVHLSFALFGESAWAARLPTVVFSFLAIPVAGALAGLLYGRRARLVTLAVMAVAPAQIAYAQDARMYAPLILFALAATWCFVRWMTRPTRAMLALYVGCAALCCYTHYFAAFILIGHDVAALVWWRHARRDARAAPVSLAWWALGQVVVLALFAPWLAVMMRRFGAVQDHFWIPAPTLYAIYEALQRAWAQAWPLCVALVALACAPRLQAWAPRAWRGWLGRALAERPADGPYTFDDARPRATLLAPFAVSVLVPLGLSFVVQPFFLHRYLAAAFTLATVLAIAGALRFALPTWRAVAVIALVALGVPRLVRYYDEPQKPRWSEAARAISARMRDGDVLVPWPFWARFPLEVNGRVPLPPSAPLEHPDVGSTPAALSELVAATHAAPRLWLVLGRDHADTGERVLGALEAARPRVSLTHFASVDVYELGAMTPTTAPDVRAPQASTP